MAWITKEKRLALYIRDGFVCWYCGADLCNVLPSDITLDHLVPRCKGGTNEDSNLITACRLCNCALKHVKDWTEFAEAETVTKIDSQRREPLDLSLAKSRIAAIEKAENTRAK
jgi:5-methylcytosine-specific restriction endonuclease McrA